MAKPIEPLDRALIAEARKRVEDKAAELLRVELATLLKPRNEAIASAVTRREELMSELEELNADIDRMRDEVAEITGVPRQRSLKQKREGKRRRRSKEELQGMAADVLNYIKSCGKSGASGPEIRAKFPDIGPSIKPFIKQWGHVTLKHEGSKKEGTWRMP